MTPIRLTVLGSSCSIPRPGRASSSYLFETATAAIVADFGTGAFANLVRYRAPETVGAIFISHMHADHFIDLIALRYALRYGVRSNDLRLPLYLPPGGEETLRAMIAPLARETGDFLDDVFCLRTYDVTQPVRVGDVAVRFAPTSHYIACYAMRFDSTGVALAYSADTAPDDSIAAFADGAQALLCEATLAREEEALQPRGHLSAFEAGALAARARVQTLLLTHYPASADGDTMIAAARSNYAGPIHVVDDGDRFEVSTNGVHAC